LGLGTLATLLNVDAPHCVVEDLILCVVICHYVTGLSFFSGKRLLGKVWEEGMAGYPLPLHKVATACCASSFSLIYDCTSSIWLCHLKLSAKNNFDVYFVSI